MVFTYSIVSIQKKFLQDYTINIFFRQEWYDERLSNTGLGHSVTLNHKHRSMIWVPDVFMPNEKSATFHDLTVPNVLLRLDPDGKILYSQRWGKLEETI